MMELFERTEADGRLLVPVTAEPEPPKKGDRVRIEQQGPFEGFFGIIEEIGGTRAKLWVQDAGKKVSVQLSSVAA